MAEITTVARPYAKAAFQHALAQNQLAEWSAMLGFAAAVASDSSVKPILSNPKLTAQAKAEAVATVCGDKLSEQGRNFISLLAQNKRLAALPEIAHLYDLLRAEQERTVDVEITTAFAATDEQVKSLANALKQKLGRDVAISNEIDASLIGGAVIRAGDLVIDGSVRGKLTKLANTLNS